MSFTLNPLLFIALLASLFEARILLFEIKSKKLIPFSTSFNLTFICGRSELRPKPAKVSLAVCSAFLEAVSP